MQDVNVYATYSRGYKGPLIAYATGKPLLPVDPIGRARVRGIGRTSAGGRLAGKYGQAPT